jgi:hypothetical protein
VDSFFVIQVALVGLALPAHADSQEDAPAPALSVDEFRGDMHEYFREEKRGGTVLMAMGAAGVALGGGLFAQDQNVWRGFAYPVLIFGAVEALGGLLFYARTNRQVAALERGLRLDLQTTRARELSRMRRINLEFALIQALEITLMVGGVVMSATGAVVRNDQVLGAGLGMSLESVSLLTFDLFAKTRALRYTSSLERLIASGP